MEQRRLGREDLAKSSPFVGGERDYPPLLWRVYESYEVRDGDEPPATRYFLASKPKRRGASRIAATYDPLVDTPYLFLEFARIGEGKNLDLDALAYQWIGKYGLLGLTDPHSSSQRFGVLKVVSPPLRYDDRGGPGEYVDVFWYMAAEARFSLWLYEAILNRDVEELEWLLFTEDDLTPKLLERRLRRARRIMDETDAEWLDVLADQALRRIWEHMGWVLDLFTYPTVTFSSRRLNSPLTGPNDPSAGYGARNLLGAMYLQFYWLITSGSDLSRCKQCRRIISHASPISKGTQRKPRKDKQFCDSRCRQNYHYHTRIKSARRG